jgi:hypothetical protein
MTGYPSETMARLVIGSVISLVILVIFSRFIKTYLTVLGDKDIGVFAGDMIIIAAPVVICMLFFMWHGYRRLRTQKA